MAASLLSDSGDPCAVAVRQFCDPDGKTFSEADVISEFISCFYKIGVIGVKINDASGIMWADHDHAVLTKSEAKRANSMQVHKMLFRALGIRVAAGH